MKQVNMYFHAGSQNHGCEAIVRSTAALLGTKPLLFSGDREADLRYGLHQIADITQETKGRISFGGKVLIKLSGSDRLAYQLCAKSEAQAFAKQSVAMSVGGDNYCYGDGYNWHLAGLNRAMHQRGIKTVLWGCSIEPKTVTESMKKDFARYDLIVARESISYEFLKKINPNTIYACDPAFTLKKEELPLPAQFVAGKTVGINISPLIQKSEQIPGITYENYKNMIAYILANTDYNIALIPHVVQEGNDDRKPLLALYEEIADKSRVCVIDDCNCEQLKGYISRCAMFIGARTHATIAAYSTLVPTLVVGYSTKAIGIARDLFGTEEGYVLPVQNINSPNDLTEAFVNLEAEKENIQNALSRIMPEYSKTIEDAKKAVERLY